MAHRFKKISHNLIERTSSFTSRGSITLEAALAVPIFFFGILSLVYLMEILSVRTTMKSALYTVSREMAREAWITPVIVPSHVEKEIVELIGRERLDRSIVANGSNGLDCSGSKRLWNTSIMELRLRYQIKIPIIFFKIPLVDCIESVRIKGWTGYEDVLDWGNSSEEMVYITETGIVYHKDPDCTYLELSIQPVEKSLIDGLRNESGEKYKKCFICMKKVKDVERVYITDTGNHYHSSVNCSGLKRNVYAVRISEVYGKGGCSRCVK